METLNGVSLGNGDTGWAVGGTTAYSGTIVRTTNGGATWTPQMSGAVFPLYGVSFLNANIGTAVGGFRGLGSTFGSVVLNRQSKPGRGGHFETRPLAQV